MSFARYKKGPTIYPETGVGMTRYQLDTEASNTFYTYPMANYDGNKVSCFINGMTYNSSSPATYHVLAKETRLFTTMLCAYGKRNIKFNGTIFGTAPTSEITTIDGISFYSIDPNYVSGIGFEEYKLGDTVYGRQNFISTAENTTTYNVSFYTSTQIASNYAFGCGYYENDGKNVAWLITASPTGATTFKIPKMFQMCVYAEDEVIINGTSYGADTEVFFGSAGSTCSIVFNRTRVGLLNWEYRVTVTGDDITVFGSI